jgi:hypothetical protein
VIVNTTPPFFARMYYIFSCTPNHPNLDESFTLALVHAFDVVDEADCPEEDRYLGVLRLRPKPIAETEFAFVDTIIRGALITPCGSDPNGDYLLVDVIDHDMFLRIKTLYPGRTDCRPQSFEDIQPVQEQESVNLASILAELKQQEEEKAARRLANKEHLNNVSDAGTDSDEEEVLVDQFFESDSESEDLGSAPQEPLERIAADDDDECELYMEYPDEYDGDDDENLDDV